MRAGEDAERAVFAGDGVDGDPDRGKAAVSSWDEAFVLMICCKRASEFVSFVTCGEFVVGQGAQGNDKRARFVPCPWKPGGLTKSIV